LAEPTLISLYSGAGGMDLGFVRAGFSSVFAIDIDAQAAQAYRAVMQSQSCAMRVGDVRAQSDLPTKGDAQVVIGGPPCQGFSVAGRMDPSDPRSRHVWDFMRMVGRVRPDAFVMENVAALATNRRWADVLAGLLEHARGMGYDAQAHVLKASDFGVPQARTRMFLIGVAHGHGTVTVRPPGLDRVPTVRSALDKLPGYGRPGNDTRCKARITPARTPVLRRSPFAGMLFNGQGRPMDLDRPAPTLPASMGGNRTPIIDQDHLEHGHDPWVVDYHRHLVSGGSPFCESPSRLRRITVEEAAAIQTFPLSVEWAGPQSAKYRQIGNAVPPDLAYHVALAVRQVLAD
jgi:DNA (cytosine-5)-methyltransferase 1